MVNYFGVIAEIGMFHTTPALEYSPAFIDRQVSLGTGIRNLSAFWSAP